jgi:hypothetical protein
MTGRHRELLRWLPRALGIGVACFLALFALDVFREERGVLATTLALLVHLVPALLVVATLVVAWRRPWVGALVFLGLAAGYAAMVPRRPDWILVIGGPLALVGVLFALSWRTDRGAAGDRRR